MSKPYIPDAEAMGKLIGACIREALVPIKTRLDALERAIEGRGVKFLGKHNRDIDYREGDVVAHGGSLWVASRATRNLPGAGSDWMRMLTADKRGGFTTEETE